MKKKKPDKLKVLEEIHKFERDYVRKNSTQYGNGLNGLYEKKRRKNDKKN